MLSSLTVKERALELGFDLAGIAPVGIWKDLEFSRRWVEKGFNGEMRYLENPKRFDPHLVLRAAKSVICVGLAYHTPRRSEKSEAGSQETEEKVSGVRCRVPEGECTTEKEAKKNSGNLQLKTAPAPSPQSPAPFFFHGQRTTDSGRPRAWISRYAWGQDYHQIMRAKLEELRAVLEELAPGIETRVFVDTGPVVERAFARFSGLGWMGKNTCIINQEKGSWFFLGVMLTSLELAPDLPAPDRCGSCTACLDACPTEALVEPYVMNASRCISYFTIEIKGAIPEQFRPKIGANVFGCDICQDVCPWNRETSHQLSVVSCQSQNFSHHPSVVSRQLSASSYQQSPSVQRQSSDEHCGKQAATTKIPQFHPLMVEPTHPALSDGGTPEQLTTDHGRLTTDNGPLTTDNGPLTTDHGPLTTDTASFSLFHPTLDVLALISESDFRRIFAHSPIKRVKYRGWLSNLCVAMGNSGDERFVPWLERAAQHSDPIVREHAAWALERLRNK